MKIRGLSPFNKQKMEVEKAARKDINQEFKNSDFAVKGKRLFNKKSRFLSRLLSFNKINLYKDPMEAYAHILNNTTSDFE